MPARAKNPFTGVQLAKRGYSALLPRHERRELLVLIHQELEMESEEYLKSHLVASLLNLARLQKTRNPQLSARYSSDSLFVSANFKGSNSEGPEDDLPGKKPKKPRAPRAPRAKKPPRAKLVQYNDEDGDNDPWKKKRPREEKYPDDDGSEDEKMDYRYSDDDDDSDDGSDGDVHFSNAPISGGKRRRDDDDGDEKEPKKSKSGKNNRKRKNNESSVHGESKRARKTASRKRKVRRDGLGDDDPASNKRPRTEPKRMRKRKNETPGEILQAEEENPGISLLHPDRHDQYLREEKEYQNNVGSVANDRERRVRPRIDYAAMHNEQRIDGEGLAVVHITGLKKSHVTKWKNGKAVRLDGGSISLHPVAGSHPVYLEMDQHKKAVKAKKGQKINLKVSRRAGMFTRQEVGGGLFDSFGDFVSGVWDGVKTVGKFIWENGPAILETISELLPPNSPQLIAAKAALKAASQGIKVVDGIRSSYEKASDAKKAAQDKVDQEKQKALDKELALREAGAKKEQIEKAKKETAARIAKLKEEAKKRGREEVAKKKQLRAQEKKVDKLSKTAEDKINIAKAKAGVK